MNQLNQNPSDEFLMEMIDEVDSNHDGRIDYFEFEKLMSRKMQVAYIKFKFQFDLLFNYNFQIDF